MLSKIVLLSLLVSCLLAAPAQATWSLTTALANVEVTAGVMSAPHGPQSVCLSARVPLDADGDYSRKMIAAGERGLGAFSETGSDLGHLGKATLGALCYTAGHAVRHSGAYLVLKGITWQSASAITSPFDLDVRPGFGASFGGGTTKLHFAATWKPDLTGKAEFAFTHPLWGT